MTVQSSDSHFRYDAFISYAHRDNETGVISAFHAQLEEFLASSLRREPSVWLDEIFLTPEANVGSAISTALKSSAVLIVVASETTESRKWCRDELGWFGQGAEYETMGFGTERVNLVYMPFEDHSRLPRFAKHLDDAHQLVLDPNCTQLTAEQDYDEHKAYWNQLYGWFERLSERIVRVQTAFAKYHPYSAVRQPPR